MPVLILATTDQTWKSKWAELSRDFFNFDKPGDFVVSKTKKILKDKISDPDKISALRKFISENIVSIPVEPFRFCYQTRDPESILRSGYGHELDRLKLLAAMVEAAGGSFSLCLAGPSAHVSNTVPCLRSLPDFFARVSLGSESSLIHLDDEAFSAYSLLGKRAASLSREKSDWMSVPGADPDDDQCRMTISCELDDKEILKGNIELVYAGAFNPFAKARWNTSEWLKGCLPEFIQEPKILTTNVLNLSPDGGPSRFLIGFEGKVKWEELDDALKMIVIPNCPQGLQEKTTSFLRIPIGGIHCISVCAAWRNAFSA